MGLVGVLVLLAIMYVGVGLGKLREKFSWKTIDFAFASDAERQYAISNEEFIPKNIIPITFAIDDRRVFVSMPRREKGVPATLAYFDRYSKDKSPKLIPYPSLKDNKVGVSCNNLISVNRGIRFDKWGRLWVLDTGKVGKGSYSKQVCPPKLMAFNATTNEKLFIYTLKANEYTTSSIFTSVSVDVGTSPEDTCVYTTDQCGLFVYCCNKNEGRRFTHPFFGVDPIATDFCINGDELQWNDAGVFATAVSPAMKDGSRDVYFHALASFREFKVSNKILRDKTKVVNNYHDLKLVGCRGNLGRSTTEVFDKQGVLFFNLIDKHGVACWKSGTPYKVGEQITIVAQDYEKLKFLSASVIDGKENLLWILSIRSPILTSKKLNSSQVNFIIFNGAVKDLKAGTPCGLD